MSNQQRSFVHRVFWWIGFVLCVILVAILIMNITMIVKSYVHPDRVPDFFGIKPFIVLSGSMEPTIKAGDIAIVRETDTASLKAGDVIAFRTGDVVVTHRIIEVQNNEDGAAYITKGDNNNGVDSRPVTPENVEGIYISRVGGVGNFALFLQTPVGLLLFVVTPLLLFILYDFVLRKASAKKKTSREKELEQELAKLKADKEKNDSLK